MAIDFDLLSDGFQQDPFSLYARLRREAPIFRHPSGYTVLSRYADVLAALRAPDAFSSRPMVGVAPYLREDRSLALAFGSMIGLDAPRHAVVRGAFGERYLKRRVAAREPRLRALGTALVERFAARGACDLIAEFARPFMAACIGDLLEIEPARVERFRAWSEREHDAHGAAEQMELLLGIAAFVTELVESKRCPAAADPIGLLLAGEAAGRITRDEAIATAGLLIESGSDETACLFGNIVLALDEHREQAAAVRAERGLIPGLVAETLRHSSPVQLVMRKATRTCALPSGPVEAGESLLLLLASANRDERAFDEPDRFDVRRRAHRQLGFGLPPHFCLGAWAALLAARVMTELVLERLPGLRVDRARVRPKPGFLVRGPGALPVAFEPVPAGARGG